MLALSITFFVIIWNPACLFRAILKQIDALGEDLVMLIPLSAHIWARQLHRPYPLRKLRP